MSEIFTEFVKLVFIAAIKISWEEFFSRLTNYKLSWTAVFRVISTTFRQTLAQSGKTDKSHFLIEKLK